jgi:flavin reductase (DIM6/NTAB) family NADH-FMN oxidoreductase RutF
MPPPSSPLALFRRLTTGVYVIGVAHQGRSNAFTAAWVTQVSFDPLLVGLSVNPENFSRSLLHQSRIFTVNVLKKGQLDLARHFGTQSGRDVDKLTGQRWREGALGTPILSDAAAYLDCRVVDLVRAGDHELILGEPVGGEVLDNADPMVYAETGNLDGSSGLYPPSFPGNDLSHVMPQK